MYRMTPGTQSCSSVLSRGFGILWDSVGTNPPQQGPRPLLHPHPEVEVQECDQASETLALLHRSQLLLTFRGFVITAH